MKLLKLTGLAFLLLVLASCGKKTGKSDKVHINPIVPKSISVQDDVMTVVFSNGKKVVTKAKQSMVVGDKIKNIFAVRSPINYQKTSKTTARAMAGTEGGGWGDPDPEDPGDPDSYDQLYVSESESESDPQYGPPLYVVTGASILRRNGVAYAATGLYMYVDGGNWSYTDIYGRATTRNVTMFDEYKSWWASGGVTCYWTCLLNWRWSYADDSPTYTAETSYSRQKSY